MNYSPHFVGLESNSRFDDQRVLPNAQQLAVLQTSMEFSVQVKLQVSTIIHPVAIGLSIKRAGRVSITNFPQDPLGQLRNFRSAHEIS